MFISFSTMIIGTQMCNFDLFHASHWLFAIMNDIDRDSHYQNVLSNLG